ncbi:hypothetical protein QBC43DRAFT_355996 [Cladorrhinum sp. PSN259]|nr:hypothetical protein QBC43DRAFT_355996 [Cladorrhinum sp. PSN259]
MASQSADDRAEPTSVVVPPTTFVEAETRASELARQQELEEIKEFNDRGKEFCAFPVLLCPGQKVDTWVVFVGLGAYTRFSRFPKQGDHCKLHLRFPLTEIAQGIGNEESQSTTAEIRRCYEATRADLVGVSFGFTHPEWQNYSAFRFTVETGALKDIENLMSNLALMIRDGAGPREILEVSPVKVVLELEPHTATIDAELAALELMEQTMDTSDIQRNLFADFPHMAKPTKNSGISEELMQLYKGFDEDQKNVYHGLLNNLPCGIGMIPGGSGCGKKLFNYVVALLCQAKLYLKGPSEFHTAKVLYLTDIDESLDKISRNFVKLYSDVKLYRVVIHVTSSCRKNPYGQLDFTRGFLDQARLHRRGVFEGRHKIVRPTHRARTLDELVWDHYQHFRNKYHSLRQVVPLILKNEEDLHESFALQVTDLYEEVLGTVNTVCATPVAVSQGFGKIWNPDIVFFNVSPHVRELSLLISVAQFNPRAWIFTGDHRQMRPSTHSYRRNTQESSLSDQRPVSTMKRAHALVTFRYELFTSHRACGNLCELPSRLFYDGKLRAADEISDVALARNLFEKHLRPLLNGKVVLPEGDILQRVFLEPHSVEATTADSSVYNDGHTDYVVRFVKKLCTDRKFTKISGTCPGTVMIIVWFEAQRDRYLDTIRLAELDRHRVRAVTVDSSQGNAADFVVVDFVGTKLDFVAGDLFGLATAMTRAKQGELVLVHESMLVAQLPDGESNPLHGFLEEDGWGSWSALVEHCLLEEEEEEEEEKSEFSFMDFDQLSLGDDDNDNSSVGPFVCPTAVFDEAGQDEKNEENASVTSSDLPEDDWGWSNPF